MLETSTTLAESEKYHRDLQSLTLIPSYREKEVVVISKEIVASPRAFQLPLGARKYAAGAAVGIPRIPIEIDCAQAAVCSSNSSDRSLGVRNSGARCLVDTTYLPNLKGIAASEYLYQKVSENLTRSGQNNTTMLREFKKGRNTSMFGNKTIISNRHGYFSPRRFLFVLNLFLLIGSKIVNADQQDSSADYHDDVCSSGRDGSEAHNCPTITEAVIEEEPSVHLQEWREMLQCPAETLLQTEILGNIFVVGLVADASHLKPTLLTQLLEMSCVHQIGIHIMTRGGDSAKAALEIHDEARVLCFGSDHVCAPFHVDKDPHEASLLKQRVDRIGYIREYQRERLRSIFKKEGDFPDVVIKADLDIYSLPSNSIIMNEVRTIVKGTDHDVICSAGLMHHPFGYYDIFATVLMSNTFVYPLAGRLDKEIMSEEEMKTIRSDDPYGNFTQEDILNYFVDEGSKTSAGTVQVRSCFGGLAIYRASEWFRQGCPYNSVPGDMMKYANHDDNRPCEHVVFHECLRSLNPSIKITVQPYMNTLWDEPVDLGSFLFSGGKISHALGKRNGLVTSARRPDKGLRVQNGKFALRIDGSGSLVVEGKDRRIKWKITSKSESFQEDWDHMFLTLERNGELVLSQQTSRQCLSTECYQSVDDKPCKPCRVVVWSSGTQGDSFSSAWILHLGHDGILRVVSLRSKEIIWQSEEGDHSSVDSMKQNIEMHFERSGSSCIPSGDEKSINKALAGHFAEAVLCQGAVFNLAAPIKFTDFHQMIYTQGHPIGNKRAVLRIVNPSVATAVNMLSQDYAELSHVIIDGNRQELGRTDVMSYGDALIRAGGEATGQIVRHVDAWDARTWSILHLTEGDLLNRCAGALVENNKFGPVGNHTPAFWANGISMACTHSIVRNNTIIDASDVGLALFGALGSIIEDNEIISNSQAINVGISLVDYGPFDGSFNGTIVRGNIINAENATIGVGVAMGPRVWQCMHGGYLTEHLLWGAAVTDNVLLGEHMQYGFAVDGVKDWTIMGNIDNAKHVGEPSMSCHGSDLPSAPDGFLIDRTTSTGVFQAEFQNAKNLENIVSIARREHMRLTCISSGDQDTIIKQLVGQFAEVSLCQGVVLNLTAPIKFTDIHQKIYTQGYPIGNKRATLRLADPFVTTAVHMLGKDYAELSHVMIDGNRPELGRAGLVTYGDALIRAGGEAIGQVFRHIDAWEARSWSILHLSEGDPSKWCSGALVENNIFGPVGMHLPKFGANGISMACTESIIKNNTVIDATDVALVLFGAPGSIVEDNLIINRERAINGGITLVDYDPFKGNFEGSIVQRNIINAENATIGVGVAMGPRIWQCMEEDILVERTLRGAVVKDNVLMGEHMQYGFVVDGVSNWTVMGNIDKANHVGTPLKSCGGRNLPSPPGGFMVDRTTSKGNFQSEFQNANLENIVSLSMSEHVVQPKRACIPSGNQDSINNAFVGQFSQSIPEIILCQGAVFNLTAPVQFRHYQKMYTEGKPTDDKRAVLRLVDTSVTTAVNMLNQEHAELSHVIIDGNRPELGASDVLSYKEALIRAGGEATGQVFRNIDAWESRSWSILHLTEGDSENRCSGALVENNNFGPTGIHFPDLWSDGISMACTKSIVKNNTIVDATDVGLVVFGAPGSIIEDNMIINRERRTNGGITLVDYGPYDGNFEGSIVRRNTINAENATIGVGLGMGQRIWLCMSELQLEKRLLRGATVTDNVLMGDHMPYGFVVDGVRDWTVMRNIDNAKHGGKSLRSCFGSDAPSPPGGFLLSNSSSTGVFQAEFQDARLENLVYAVESFADIFH